jgi:two-component system sensor histidine kinase ChvG
LRRTLSARAVIFGVSVGLVLVPFAAMLAGWVVERWIVRTYHQQLASIATEARSSDGTEASLSALAAKRGVMLRIVKPDGAASAELGKSDDSVWVRGPIETITDWLAGPDRVHQQLAQVELEFGPIEQRPEVLAALQGEEAFEVHVSSGQTVAMTLAAPLKKGSVVVLTKASHRGVRELLDRRRELMRLTLYQAVAALVAAFALGHWLIRPLDRLATAAQRHPPRPIDMPELAARQDELGKLARALTELTASLDARRKEAVDLAADLAHEFKNPLATIAAAAEHLGTTRALTDEKRQLLASASSSAASRLLATTEALLSLARLEASLPAEQRERVDYRAFLEALLAEYRANPSNEGIAFELTGELGEITVVRSAWQRLMRNLLDNAVVHAAPKGKVSVEVRVEKAAVVTAVTDSGPGVSEGNRDKIFRRFFTVRPEGQPNGTGLGLTIAQAIAVAHGGTVTLASPPGAGARFEVRLPTS